MYARILQSFFKTVKVRGCAECAFTPHVRLLNLLHAACTTALAEIQSRKLTTGLMRKFRQVVRGISNQVRCTLFPALLTLWPRRAAVQELT